MPRSPRIRPVLVVALLLGLSGVSRAGVPAASYDYALELFSASGLERQIGSVAAGAGQQFAAQSGALPAGPGGQIRLALEQAYDPALMRREALEDLRAGIDDEKAKAVLVWLRSDAGRRITEFEEQASTPAAMTAMQQYANSLSEHPPTEVRLALIRRLDAATHSSELSTDVAMRIAAAVARSITFATPGVEDADLAAAMEAQRPRMQEAMAQLTIVSFLYTYQEVDDSTLDAYAAFLESPDGRWYYELTSSAFVDAIDAGTERLETSLRRAVAVPEAAVGDGAP